MLYQPIVGLDDRRVRGVEALVRWAHPTFGLLGPDQFIDLAEETGAIVPLGRRVLIEACERAAEWNAEHPGRGAVRQRQPGRPAGPRPGPGRRRRADPGEDRAAAAAAAAGADRERPARAGRAAGGGDHRAGRDGHPDRRRRLRHRLLQPRLPAPAAAAHHEAGRGAHRGPAPAHHGLRLDRGQPDLAGPRARPGGHRGGGGDRGAGRAAARRRLRHRPGLALRPAGRVGRPARAAGRAAPRAD